MKKKIFSLLLCLAMVLSIVGVIAPQSVEAASVKLNKKKVTVYAGNAYKLKLKKASGEITWASSKTSVATVKNGKITAKKAGKATITATYKGKTYKCKVTVKEFESSFDAVANMKIGWNLGNYFDATGRWMKGQGINTFLTGWGNSVVDESLFKKLKNLGFGAVRVPVTWMYHFDENGNINSEWMAKVKETVDWVLANDMYCIINIHHDTGAKEDDKDKWLFASTDNYDKNHELYAKLWTQIANEFKDYPQTLLFESFNEMLDEKNDWNEATEDARKAINKYNQCFVDTVRATGGKNATRNLICNSYAATTSESALKYFEVPSDKVTDHIIGQVHFYQPYEFITDSGITWTTPIKTYNSYVEKTVDDKINYVGKTFGTMGTGKKGIPVIIGEFATDNKNNTSDRIKWYTRVIKDAKKYGIVCFIWDNGDSNTMGHISRTDNNDAFLDIIKACVDAAK